MRHYIPTMLFCAGLLIAGSIPVLAQMDGPPPGDEHGRQRIEQLRQLKMIEALDLDEEQALKLTVRDKEYKKKEKEMFSQRRDLLGKLREGLKEEASDEQLLQILDRIRTLHVAMADAKHEHLLSLNDFLSTQQIAKMLLFEQRFNEELRRLLSKRGSRRPLRR